MAILRMHCREKRNLRPLATTQSKNEAGKNCGNSVLEQMDQEVEKHLVML